MLSRTWVISVFFLCGAVTFGQPISSASKTLPPNFQSADFDSVFAALRDSKGSPSKGEFETTDQYNRRIQLQPKLSENELYFLYPAGSLAKYDADKEEFTVNIPTKRFYKGKPGEIAGVTKLTPPEIFHSVVARDPVTTNDGTYIGTNAYGAQVTVFKRSTTERRLIVSNFSESRGGQTLLGEPSLLATFSSPQAKAQELKHNLAVLYIAKPVEPYIESSTFFDKATLNRPQDVHTTSYYLVVRVAEIWIVDSRNGTVLTAILPSDGKFTNPVPPSLLVPGKLISSAKATRSAQARKEMVSGVVTVRVVVGEDGNVISATAISGHPLLRGTSEAAARGSKFSPGVRDGKPASFEIVLTYNFPDY